MKLRVFLCIISLCFSLRVFASGIPISKLDSEALEPFLPEIFEELQKGLALQEDHRTHRCTKEYGYSFFALENGDFSYTPVPEFLQELGEKVCEALGHSPEVFTNVILSLYEEGFHLEPHEDANEYMEEKKGFFFDENVYGIIIEPDAKGHLYFLTSSLP